jgi:hypothetical protein
MDGHLTGDGARIFIVDDYYDIVHVALFKCVYIKLCSHEVAISETGWDFSQV